MAELRPFLDIVARGQALTRGQTRAAFEILMSGAADNAEIGALLMGLRVRGETEEEIAGAVEIMRQKMTPVAATAGAIDIVGTGGDVSGSYNVSTCAALVAAACGLSVAKHGNRAQSSKSGASDVLQELGVAMLADPAAISDCIEQVGIGFMFAPHHHPAMRHVAPVRAALGIQTIFNLLGPLSNPAAVRHHLIGVFSDAWLQPFARVLRELGSVRAMIVHGADGLDEITTTGPTRIACLDNGEIRLDEIRPENAGLATAAPADLVGGSPKENAEALRAVLAGRPGPYRDIVVFNVAAALWVAGSSPTIAEGAAAAAAAIDSGGAQQRLDMLVRLSKSLSASSSPSSANPSAS